MKHLFILLLSLSATFSAIANDNDAIAYNDKIVNEQTKIGEAILAFSNNPNDFSLNKIFTQAESSIEVLNKMKAYDGNKKFLETAKDLFKFYAGITKNEYRKILDLISGDKKYTSDEMTAKINELTASISKKETLLDRNFKEAQIAFAKKYNFTMSKNELEDKLKKPIQE